MNHGRALRRSAWAAALYFLLGYATPAQGRRPEAELAAATRRLNNIAAGRPHVLLSAMECGRLEHLRDTRGRPLNVQAGGQALVVNDFLTELPAFVAPAVATQVARGEEAAHEGPRVSAAFLRYEGLATRGLKRLAPLQTILAGQREMVGVWHSRHPRGAALYFFEHPLFARRTLLENTPEASIYASRGGDRQPLGQPGVPPYALPWEDAAVYSLYNQAIAALARRIEPDVYHAHDYHAALAPIYMERPPASVLTLHNGGYQGLFKTPGFGDRRSASTAEHPRGLPLGDRQRNQRLLELLRLPEATYLRYFEQDGLLNLLKGSLGWLQEHFGLAGIAVSPGYAAELRQSRDEILEQLFREQPGAAVDPERVFVPSHGLEFGNVIGITNGLARTAHASTHRELERAGGSDRLGDLQHPEVRRAFLERDLRFGSDLKSAAGRERTLASLGELKRLLQLEVFGVAAPERPVLVVVGRLVEQKGLGVLLDNVPYLVEQHGAQLLVLGSAGDAAGAADLQQLEALAARYPDAVRVYPRFVTGPLNVLSRAGADFTVLPSRFEPCGMTDIEAAWLGAVPVARRTGGLGKVQSGIYYSYTNVAERAGHVRALRAALDDALGEYRQRPQAFHERQLEGLAQSFSWQDAFGAYFTAYRAAAQHQLNALIGGALGQQRLNIAEAERLALPDLASLLVAAQGGGRAEAPRTRRAARLQ
ncbi:MAG: glycogen/starch synthase [Proteobacteria bacterium]|nr:glycogen/starch synthase [Pseudomonadota bacterium]